MANLAPSRTRGAGKMPVVSINRFSADRRRDALVKDSARRFKRDGRPLGYKARRRQVARARWSRSAIQRASLFHPDDAAAGEVRTIAKEIYRAKDISAEKSVRDQLAQFEQMGYGHLPVCIAKTQYSFSTNADTKGAPVDHTIPVREVRLSAGAEFVVAICGEIMTMPGLPRVPAADSIDVGDDGKIVGLF
jgi:formate--tetrahydrofolate ligase